MSSFFSVTQENSGDNSQNMSTLSTSTKTSRVKPSYTLRTWAKEERVEDKMVETTPTALYGVQMNPFLQSCGQYVFATVGGNRASIYECMDDGSLKLLQVYSDCEKEENFYCCCWSHELFEQDGEPPVAGSPLLIIGGARGVIRIIQPSKRECTQHLKGHGSSVNDLKLHPFEPRLLLSASRDHSIRLWNMATETCVAIFGGLEGHRDEVLSVDFHLSGKKIVSGGMDHALKIWPLDGEKITTAINDSFTFNQNKSRTPFKTAKNQFPMFTTRDVHRNYVDSVAWYGNCVMSKSCENSIVLWKPGKLQEILDTDSIKGDVGINSNRNDQTVTVLHKFECPENDIWYIRFGMDEKQSLIAIGNQIGHIYVGQIDEEDPTLSRYVIKS